MTFEWTAEQRALATTGCTLQSHGLTQTISRLWGERLFIGNVGYLFEDFDPATLQPPSLEFIQQLARERLGDRADVVDGFDGTHGQEGALAVYWYRGHHCGWAHSLSLVDTRTLDRFRAAVAAIVALSGAGLGRRA